MEGSPASFGVRTRAKTLAHEQDRKLAYALEATSRKQQNKHQRQPQIASSPADPVQTRIYLQLRRRTLMMVAPRRDQLKRRARKTKSPATRTAAAGNVAIGGGEEASSATRAVVSPASELPSKLVDDDDLVKARPIESSLSTPLTSATPGDAAPRRSVEISSLSCELAANQGVVKEQVDELDLLSTESLHSHDGMDFTGATISPFADFGALEQALLSMRARTVCGSPTSSVTSKDWDSEGSPIESPESQEPRAANHFRFMNRRYMRTKLFTDAAAIDELFSEPDIAQMAERKRFMKKYNFDVVNDKPLNGRYEWIAEPCSTAGVTPRPSQQQENPQELRSDK